MSFTVLLLIGCLVLSCSSPVYTSKKKGTVKLALYYESYCPYSMDFINDQLYPVWEEFRDYMEVYLIPFGNAEQIYVDGAFVFKCQHGVQECVGNILHACAIYQACGGNTTLHCTHDGLTSAMEYVNCIMPEYDQQQSSKKCAKESSLSEWVIQGCSEGPLGNTLESFYGNVTEAHVHPAVSYTPFIVVNGEHNAALQYMAQLDLRVLICTYMPSLCDNSKPTSTASTSTPQALRDSPTQPALHKHFEITDTTSTPQAL